MNDSTALTGTAVNEVAALTGTAVNEVAALAQAAAKAQVLKLGDYEFANRQLHRVNIDPQSPKPLEFYTLAGLVRYLLAEPAEGLLVHVVSPLRVDVVSALLGQDKHLRRHVARAECTTATMKGFQFGGFGRVEALNIALQTCFAPELGDIQDLRQFIASVRSTGEVGVADDGFSQTVHARSGIAAVKETPVRNLWKLAPWRTFQEVPQPVSPFVLRFKKDGESMAGLFETGDARWIVEAVNLIAVYLRNGLPGMEVLG